MDLSINNLKTNLVCEKNPEDRNPAAVFLPDEIPLNFKINSNINEFCQQIEELEQHKDRHRNLIESLRPYIDYLKQRYPKMDPQRMIVRRDTPANAILFDAILGINRGVRSRKQSSDADSAYMEGSLHSEPVEEFDTGMYPKYLDSNLVQIGPNGTIITKKQFESIPWFSAPVATRSLLGIIFDAEILATHTLTGKPSPAFYGRERPSKDRLDEGKVADIIECVTAKCTKTSVREIRAAITTKCADASKKKRHSFKRQDMEIDDDKAIFNSESDFYKST